jgi:hypothetical protein
MNITNHYVPQYINRNNILWWEKEEIKYVAIPFLVLALFFDYFFWGVFSSLLASYIAVRLRRRKPEGYLVHLQYAAIARDPKGKGIMQILFSGKSFPDSSKKHIIG